ncbi:MAG TPA: hypothetical protein VFX12_16245 [Vicinamibacterales bacterium]|nr:hypothetical protein [Vicinamibacterales bacterium]
MILLLAALLILAVPQAGDSLADAVSLARTHDQALFEAFNAGYQLAASGEVERVEVVTEFRRAVLLARARADQGDFSFTPRDLDLAMTPFRGRVGFLAQVRLNPLNTYATPPPYLLYIRTGPATPPLAPGDLKRDPVFPPGLSRPGTAMTAVAIEASFSRADIVGAADPHLMILDPQGTTIWDARLDLTRYR